MTNELYQKNTRSFTPYASCNINNENGCELDGRCTLFQQCVPLAAQELEHGGKQPPEIAQILLAQHGPHMNMSPQECSEEKRLKENWVEAQEAQEASSQIIILQMRENIREQIAGILGIPVYLIET